MHLLFGRHSLTLTLADDQIITHHRGPDALADVAASVRAALDAPFHFPPLRQAVTPDDRVVVVIDEAVGDVLPILEPIVEHLASVGIDRNAMTLLSTTPREVPGFVVEVHDPEARDKLAYLATSKGNRRLYLNRALVDAEQIVVISTRGFDAPGAEASLFPALSDTETRAQAISTDESQEASWLLGLPFYVQLIPACGGGVAAVVAGSAEAAREAERLRDEAWLVVVSRRPDTIVVTSSPSGAVRAVVDAAQVIQPNGRIILLVDGTPVLGAGFEVIREASDAEAAITALERLEFPDAMAWAQAASHARLSVWSDMDAASLEDFFASSVNAAEQVQRLVGRAGICLFVEDGHLSRTILK